MEDNRTEVYKRQDSCTINANTKIKQRKEEIKGKCVQALKLQ